MCLGVLREYLAPCPGGKGDGGSKLGGGQAGRTSLQHLLHGASPVSLPFYWLSLPLSPPHLFSALQLTESFQGQWCMQSRQGTSHYPILQARKPRLRETMGHSTGLGFLDSTHDKRLPVMGMFVCLCKSTSQGLR